MAGDNHQKRILIADDSSSVILLYKQLLCTPGIEIETVSNGVDALKRMSEAAFDLIITDVHMPHMDGITLCRELQKEEVTQKVPIIIVSDFDSETDVETGFEVGASAYLGKKEVRDTLCRTVSDLLWKYDHVRQKLILVVDDSKATISVIEKGLKENSFNVVTASDGLVAKDLVISMNPDLILCDLRMPNLDGYGLCKWLKMNAPVAHIPFVAMSSGEEQYVIRRIIQYGAAGYLSKPFSTSQLIVLLDRILSDHFRFLLQESERLRIERGALVNSISSLVTALEARDPYTKGHSESVSIIVTGMASLMGAERDDIDLLAIGGRLHDIGKIGIRDHVLLKPGRLTEEEFSQIKEHPTIGKRILEPIPSLTKIIPVANSHHERWDGNGYPDKLRGEKIPIWARITAVADTYDALTSDRPYRAGMTDAKAFEIIREVRGTQLCPDCVDLFFRYVETPGFINGYRKRKDEAIRM
ncbi:MAG: response regulator [Chitinispirillaceae bacterium]|nr:response regulator [Chitinispirillaceae bacterium]